MTMYYVACKGKFIGKQLVIRYRHYIKGDTFEEAQEAHREEQLGNGIEMEHINPVQSINRNIDIPVPVGESFE